MIPHLPLPSLLATFGTRDTIPLLSIGNPQASILAYPYNPALGAAKLLWAPV